MSQDTATGPAPAEITLATWLASLAAFSAAWMVIMAGRYFALQAGDVNGALGVGVDFGSWLSSVYAIGEPIGGVLGIWLGMAFSARRTLIAAVVVFLVGLCLPLVGPGDWAVLISRGLIGLAAGAIIPQCIVILLQSWAPPRTPVAIALFLSAPTAGVQIGGIVGAWGVQQLSWTYIPWACVPLGLLALAAASAGYRREPYAWRVLIHADIGGLLAMCAALGFFACAISQGDRMRWFQSPPVAILLAGSAICLAIFLVRDRRRIRHPALLVRLYRRWNIALGAAGVVALLLAIGLSTGVVPTVLAQVQGFRPEQMAPALWAAAWPQALAYPLGVVLLLRRALDPRLILLLGLAMVAGAAMVDLRLTSQWQTSELYLGQVLQGLGLPLIGLPLIYLFANDLRAPAETFPAVGLLNLSRVLGGTIATAWVSTSLRLNAQAKFNELLSNTASYPGAQEGALAGLSRRLAPMNADPALVHAQAVQLLANAARREAVVLGAASTLVTLAWLLFASGVLVVLMAKIGSGKLPHAGEFAP